MTVSPEIFRPLRLHGGRFETPEGGIAGFPVEAIAELARYERLLVKVARELWITEHRGRQRAPKGFDESLRLRLTAIEEGSVQPAFAVAPTRSDQLFDPDNWLDRAQDSIAEALSAVVSREPLPSAFPVAATSSLVSFGSSFAVDEQCVVSSKRRPEVIYSQQERRHLLQLTAPDDVKFDGSLVGRISALDADRRSFEFADRSGRRASGTFEQHGMFDELKRYMEREPNATIVRLACRYSTDNAGRLSKIEDVDDVEPVVATADPLAPELRRLLELSDGWHDGAGMGPTLMSVEWVRDFAAALDASELPELMVFPTLAGGVLVELQRRGTRWSVEVEPGGELFVAIVPADGNPEIVEAESVDDVINRLRALPA